MKKRIILIILCLSFFLIPNIVKADGYVSTSIGIECDKTSLPPAGKATCNIYVSSNRPFNSVIVKTPSDLTIKPLGSFELYSNNPNYLLISKEKIDTENIVNVGSIEIVAPGVVGTFNPITSIEFGEGDYDELIKSTNPTLTTTFNKSTKIPVFTVVNPVVTEVKSLSVELDCPKSELKVNESMKCNVIVDSNNLEYNVVVFDSMDFRNISISGQNGFEAVKNEEACKKCIGCGCTGKYSFVSPNTIKNKELIIGTVEVTAPQSTGAYNLRFQTIVGKTTASDFDANKSEITDKYLTTVTEVINVIEEEKPAEPQTQQQTPSKPTTVASNDNKISKLSIIIDGKTLAYDFESTKTIYNIPVDSNISSVKLEASLNNSKAKFVSNYGPRTIELNYGLNVIQLKVQAEDKSIKTYTLNITRALEPDTYILSSIVVNGISIPIEENKFDYYVEVPKEVNYSEIIVNVTDEKYLTSFSNIDIKDGNNDLNIKVTDLKNNNFNYHLTIYKAPKANINISDYIVLIVIIIVIILIICMLLSSISLNKKQTKQNIKSKKKKK